MRYVWTKPYLNPVRAAIEFHASMPVFRMPLDNQESVIDEGQSTEPKKKGRFIVVEQAGMAKAQSSVNLSQVSPGCHLCPCLCPCLSSHIQQPKSSPTLPNTKVSWKSMRESGGAKLASYSANHFLAQLLLLGLV